MLSRRILALVLAGGKGTRLHPLTSERAKPALPFAGGYRIVDFVLSNLVNSDITRIYVLAQYKPRSLLEHLCSAWSFALDASGRGIKVILPGPASEPAGFGGTADAVYQNLWLLERHEPDLVAVFAADHVYRMDLRQMAQFHDDSGADVTVAAVAVPIEVASSFGVLVTGVDGRISEFQEKPPRPKAIPRDPARAYASMGNYLFKPQVLAAALSAGNRANETDFGTHVLPRLARTHQVVAYDFAGNRVPGVQAHEEAGYWRDIGTIDAYAQAQRDVMGPMPRFSLCNPQWPLCDSGRRAVERTARVRSGVCCVAAPASGLVCSDGPR
jgi:glucose-1-phosphate adenylyltransferase